MSVDDDRAQWVEDWLAMYRSLNDSVRLAGGVPIGIDELDMSVRELIHRLASNKIRFYYDGPAVKAAPAELSAHLPDLDGPF